MSNIPMTVVAWRWFLPVLQIALAMSAFVYAPYRPWRQIGLLGLVWAVTLLWFFTSKLIIALRIR